MAEVSGIRKGIAIISAQLDTTTHEAMTQTGNTLIPGTTSTPSSSIRSVQQPSGPTDLWSSANGLLALNNGPAPTTTRYDSSFPINVTPPFDSNFAFYNTASDENFLALLSEPNVDTQDPFAFLTSEAWYQPQ
jgi:hypothetical protein